MKKATDEKPRFRSAAKREAYSYLEMQWKNIERKIRDNKFELGRLVQAQRQLKSERAQIQQVMQEFLK